MIEIALYQPDIAGNAGSIARLGACLGLTVTIIEPAGFVWSDSALRRAGMDYLDAAKLRRSASWAEFHASAAGKRILLLTTKGSDSYLTHRFQAGDIILLGRESAGVPDHVHAAADARLTIPMQPGMRSLNVAMACAMVAGEALRQLS